MSKNTYEQIKKIYLELKKYSKESEYIKKALEYLDLYLKGISKRGNEGYYHTIVRNIIQETYKGQIYPEAKETDFFLKFKFRPDFLILTKSEVIIIEIETTKYRALKRARLIKNKIPDIQNSIYCRNRKLRIIFYLTFSDSNLIKLLKEKYNFEVFVL